MFLLRNSIGRVSLISLSVLIAALFVMLARNDSAGATLGRPTGGPTTEHVEQAKLSAMRFGSQPWAGHVSDSLTFYDGGTPYGTTFVAESRTSSRDVQWSSVDGTEIPQYWNGYTLTTVNSTMARASQTIGGQACRYGKTTGYDCSHLASKTYQPSWSGACPSTCASSWMITNDCWATDDGDSGGPWFNGGVALGITKGHVGSFSCVYMAIDYIDVLGIYVLTN